MHTLVVLICILSHDKLYIEKIGALGGMLSMHAIMIADDERIERNYIRSIISKYPSQYFMIGEASNGEQAIRMAFDKKPDVVIMDISMPLIDGLQASKTIKSKYENTIIILNSAYSEFEFAQKAISYDLDAYLLKPASEKEIIETIESSLHKSKYYGRSGLKQKSKDASHIRDYPYAMVDRIVDSIVTKDTELLDHNIGDFIGYLKAMAADADEYRLFMINTIFTVMRAIKKVFTDDDSCVFKCEEYLDMVSRAQYWNEIFSCTEEFLELVAALLRKNYPYSVNFTDLLKNYIDENFCKELTLEKLSEVFHFSPAYLSRSFHQDKGCTINDYIRDKRIKHAIYLLENSTIAIKDISARSGFSSISHFNRVFKSVTGKTPSEFKRKGD